MISDLDAAIARRAALMEELEKLNKLIELWAWWQHSAGEGPSQPIGSGDSVAESPKPEQGGTEGGQKSHASPAEVVKEALAVLIAEERPMKRGALLSALSRRGVKVGGTDKSKVLGTILWRAKDQFVSLSGWGYWIKDRPYRPALYNPANVPEAQKDPFADLLG